MGLKRRRKKRPEVNVEEINQLIDATTERALDEEESGKIRSALHLLSEHLDELYRGSEKLNKVIEEA